MLVRHAVLAWAAVVLFAGWAMGLEPAAHAFEPYVGQIATKSLNVRAGPSTNYYVVARLQEGGFVRVVGEESGWLAIAPPAGCFSLIAAQYVDRTNDTRGVVNTDAVRVRAGSNLSGHNYAVQTKLQKGAIVKILGQADGQFLKIEPPADAKMWVTADYIKRTNGAPASTDVQLAAAEPDAKAAGAAPATPPAATPKPVSETPKPADPKPAEPKPAEPEAAVPVAAAPPAAENPLDRLTALGEGGVSGSAATKTDRQPPPLTTLQPAALPENKHQGKSTVADEPPGYAIDPALESLAYLPEQPAEPVDEPPVKAEPPAPSAALPTAVSPEATAAKPEPKSEPKAVPPPPAPKTPEECRRQLETVDAALKEELAKPLQRRDFAELLPRFRVLADQNVDSYTAAYAGIRVKQIEAAHELVEGLREMHGIQEDVRSTRKDALADRATLWPLVPPAAGGFDIEGELRPSALYDSPIGPRRYRVVDPNTTPPRTLGYVELPADTGIDVNDYLGRRVGVRASQRVLQTGNVNPIAVYVAAELVALDRSGGEPPVRMAEEPAGSGTTSPPAEKATAGSRP